MLGHVDRVVREEEVAHVRRDKLLQHAEGHRLVIEAQCHERRCQRVQACRGG
jgi:hypothetical protein